MNYALVKLGSLLAGGGVCFAAYRGTQHLSLGNDPVVNAFGSVFAQQGPLEICAAGILLWLMGKWRMHTAVH